MSNKQMHFITPSQIQPLVLPVLKAGLVPMIHGSPGIGKSDNVRAIAEALNLKLIDLRMSLHEPTDFMGLPNFINHSYKNAEGKEISIRRAEFVPFDLIPLADTPIPEGYKGWLLFFDEINQGSRDTMTAAYKVILDKMVGNHDVHPNCLMMAAGNLDSDKAITNEMGTATKARLIHFYMKPSLKEWIRDFAIPQNVDPRIIGYLNQYPDDFFDFDPDIEVDSFGAPRSWGSFTSGILEHIPTVDASHVPIFAGALGYGVGTKFNQFCLCFNRVVKVSTIIKDPMTAPIPTETEMQWATVIAMAMQIDDKNISALSKYISRFTKESFIILFFTLALQRNKLTVMSDADARNSIITLGPKLFNELPAGYEEDISDFINDMNKK